MSSKDTSDTSTQVDSSPYFGRVKWFNNKAGYGFITVVGSEGSSHVGDDVFVHHTGIQVGSEQYKYLVQGEYVTFTLRSSDSSDHPYQASDLTGLFGGPLMCETRNEQRQLRSDREDGADTEHRPQHRQRRSRPRGGGGPRDSKWSVSDNRSRGRPNSQNVSE
jgi:cold shock CspA family protein